MYEDDVIKELRDVKDRFAARYGYDVRKMACAIRERQRASGREVATRKA